MGIYTRLRDRLERHWRETWEAERDCWESEPGPAEPEPPEPPAQPTTYTPEEKAAAAFLNAYRDVLDGGLALTKLEADQEHEQARTDNDDDPATRSLRRYLDNAAKHDEALRHTIAEGLTPSEALDFVRTNGYALGLAIDSYRESNRFQYGYREKEVEAAVEAKDSLRRLTRPDPEAGQQAGVEPRPFDPTPEPGPGLERNRPGPRMTM